MKILKMPYKRWLASLIIVLFLFSCTGCDATGSLEPHEKEQVMSYLVDNGIIDNSVELTGSAVGEGELCRYMSDVTVNGEARRLVVVQSRREETYRIFSATIRDLDGNTIDAYEIRVDR